MGIGNPPCCEKCPNNPIFLCVSYLVRQSLITNHHHLLRILSSASTALHPDGAVSVSCSQILHSMVGNVGTFLFTNNLSTFDGDYCPVFPEKAPTSRMNPTHHSWPHLSWDQAPWLCCKPPLHSSPKTK